MRPQKISNYTFTLYILYFTFSICSSCSVSHRISRSANELLHKPSLQTAYIGVSIYEPASGKYWYEHNGAKYFVPASNTKIPTCYAAMKYLGDSLPGLKYGFGESGNYSNPILCIQPTGDPSFLHNDFKYQPVFDFLRQHASATDFIGILDTTWNDNAWGSGWSWNDFNDYYMAERNSFPVYGNTIRFIQVSEKDSFNFTGENNTFVYTEPDIDWDLEFRADTAVKPFYVERRQSSNVFEITQGKEKYKEQEVPFITYGYRSATELLYKLLEKDFVSLYRQPGREGPLQYTVMRDDKRILVRVPYWKTIYSQPTDSLLRLMMHRSDNFFAEQSLLMVSNELLGNMNDRKIIDTLLNTVFSDLPQRPHWTDGSGLSRYNLFTPEDFISILNKMKNEFGMQRIKGIFATGGTGTIRNYYKADSGYIYAKTGTLTGVVALSGYLYTKKDKLLLFSVLVNNHQASATEVRRAVEKFLQDIRKKY